MLHAVMDRDANPGAPNIQQWLHEITGSGDRRFVDVCAMARGEDKTDRPQVAHCRSSAPISEANGSSCLWTIPRSL
jgi:hypothetical protein